MNGARGVIDCMCGGSRLRASEADGVLGGSVYCERGLSCQHRELPQVIAACDGCGMGFVSVREIGSMCFCRGGHIWYLPKAEQNILRADDKARRRALVALAKRTVSPLVEHLQAGER